MEERHGWEVIPYIKPGSDKFTNGVICEGDYNTEARNFIKKYKSAGDLLLCIWGYDNKVIADTFPDLKVIEPIVGYRVSAIFSNFRVFESYAHMHAYYGYANKTLDAQWFDVRIPASVNLNEFTFSYNKQDYLLFIGRVTPEKGIHVAIQASQFTNQKLIVAGPGSLKACGYSSIPSNVEEIGVASPEKRAELLSNAKAILAPTYYVEPFGNVTIEAYASGTPVIATDWGAFTETIEQGVTGFRCREFREFTQAINNIDKLNNLACYKKAINLYSDEVVHNQFNNYFNKLVDMNFYRN
jgi:glycosyltransferase involved in cell wall biosynthesis